MGNRQLLLWEKLSAAFVTASEGTPLPLAGDSHLELQDMPLLASMLQRRQALFKSSWAGRGDVLGTISLCFLVEEQIQLRTKPTLLQTLSDN